jgi:hypothetical protein
MTAVGAGLNCAVGHDNQRLAAYDSPVICREDSMTHSVVGDDRSQSTLFPERLDDYLGEDNPVRAIDVLVDELDLRSRYPPRGSDSDAEMQMTPAPCGSASSERICARIGAEWPRPLGSVHESRRQNRAPHSATDGCAVGDGKLLNAPKFDPTEYNEI